MNHWLIIRGSFDCFVSEKKMTIEVFDDAVCFQIKDGSGQREVMISRNEFEPFIIKAFKAINNIKGN